MAATWHLETASRHLSGDHRELGAPSVMHDAHLAVWRLFRELLDTTHALLASATGPRAWLLEVADIWAETTQRMGMPPAVAELQVKPVQEAAGIEIVDVSGCAACRIRDTGAVHYGFRPYDRSCPDCHRAQDAEKRAQARHWARITGDAL